MDKPHIIPGGIFSDHRGSIVFANDFDMREVVRMYAILHPDTEVVRAWQGHRVEKKWFCVTNGAFRVGVVKPSDWSAPQDSMADEVYEYTLDAATPAVLCIPAGYANGFKAIQKDSRLLVFSNLPLGQAGDDNYRFEQNLWLDWQQNNKEK